MHTAGSLMKRIARRLGPGQSLSNMVGLGYGKPKPPPTKVEATPEFRRIPLRKADIDRVIKSVQSAGLNVTGVEVHGDGSFNVLTSALARSQAETFADWRARHAERSSKRT